MADVAAGEADPSCGHVHNHNGYMSAVGVARRSLARRQEKWYCAAASIRWGLAYDGEGTVGSPLVDDGQKGE